MLNLYIPFRCNFTFLFEVVIKSCANGLLMRFVHLIKGDTGELAKTLPNSLRTTLWKCACLSHSVIDGRIWSLVHHGAGLLYEIR